MRSVPDSTKRTPGKGDRHALDDFGDGRRLGLLRLQEFQPRRRGEEQVAHFDDRARIGGRRPDRCRILPPATAISRRLRYRRRRLAMLSLATEPIEGSASPRKPSVRISSSVVEIFEVQCRRTASSRSAGIHAGAVVADAQQRLAAAGRGDLDAGRTGVERILDQFLGSARRPFDDFAGGDLVDEGFGELSDGHVPFSRIRMSEGRLKKPASRRVLLP